MKTSFPRGVVALLALLFVVAACSGESGTAWTFAPTTASETESGSAEPAEADITEAPAEAAEPMEPELTEAPAESTEPEEPAAVAGEPRVIELQADSALRFTDTAGQQVPDIAVVPGETIRFEIDNTAGFPHNFWIGSDAELSAFGGTTDVGIPDWSTGVEVLEWTVPADITDLKFACTVAGHYFTMQGTFSAAEAAAEPAEPAEAEITEAPAEAAEPTEPELTEAPAEPTEPEEPAAVAGEPRVIELEADPAIRFLQDGQQIQNIDVTPGETVIFRIDNTAGFPHNFYIGADAELQVMSGTTDVGIPDWDTGIMELQWVVPEDVSDIRFACTVPGHYFTMQGDFTVSP